MTARILKFAGFPLYYKDNFIILRKLAPLFGESLEV